MAIKFSEVAASVDHALMDFLGDSNNPSALDLLVWATAARGKYEPAKQRSEGSCRERSSIGEREAADVSTRANTRTKGSRRAIAQTTDKHPSPTNT